MPASSADVARIHNIAKRVQAAGVKVHFVKGWRSRGTYAFSTVPRGLIDHHDASSSKSGKWGALSIVTSGRSGLQGPLSQFVIARGDTPHVAVVAAGRANHAGIGGPHKGIPGNSANSYTYGIEKANNGTGESYSNASIVATRVLFAAIAAECRFGPHMVIGHKEWTSRKIDPTYSMAWMRNLVDRTMEGEDMALSDKDVEKVAQRAADLAVHKLNREDRYNVPWRDDEHGNSTYRFDTYMNMLGRGVYTVNKEAQSIADKLGAHATNSATRMTEIKELIAQGQDGTLDAQAVVDQIAERLASDGGDSEQATSAEENA